MVAASVRGRVASCEDCAEDCAEEADSRAFSWARRAAFSSSSVRTTVGSSEENAASHRSLSVGVDAAAAGRCCGVLFCAFIKSFGF